MAFASMEIVCGYAGSQAQGGKGQPLLGRPAWSQSMAEGGTTTLVAPAIDASRGAPVFYVLASANSYVAIGPNPNALASPRIPVQQGVPLPIYAEPGDKLAWVAA